MANMQLICMNEPDFYAFVEQVYAKLKANSETRKQRWVTATEAMAMLNIRSKTTMLGLRQSGALKYSQPKHKVILYCTDSINEYLEKHAQNTF